MKLAILISFLLLCFNTLAQDFECNGAFYLIISSESESNTQLYEIQHVDGNFMFNEIPLSENRKLAGLTYNTSDLRLWALDIENFEFVRIDRSGFVESMGKVSNVDTTLSYSSGMMSPSGDEYFFLSYHPTDDIAEKFYEVDLSRDTFIAEFDDISKAGASRILDISVDPVFGSIYGFNNLNGTIVQFGIDGQIATVSQFPQAEQSIEALFFNRAAQLFGYSPNGRMYEIDKVTGDLRYITNGPQGANMDGCACPYTSRFEKVITPEKIIPCEPFEVTYTFINNLGISHTGIELRDTFPDGFEIQDISASIPYTLDPISSQSNILYLKNMIYLMGLNTITITVQPPSFFFSTFETQAKQDSFPAAVGIIQYSDDPVTEVKMDATLGEIVSEDDLNISDQFQYSCDGLVARIQSPVVAADYKWSTGDTTEFIDVSEVGWYTLKVITDCFDYFDSVYVGQFLEAQSVSLGDDRELAIGDSVYIEAKLKRGEIRNVLWQDGTEDINCDECSGFWFSPIVDTEILVTVQDDNGCTIQDEVVITVASQKNTYIPNVFSPNGDGVNDVFYISSSLPGFFDISIYNRWGNLVFEKERCELSDDSDGWNGLQDGALLENGTFVWVAKISYATGVSETIVGDVAIISR